MGDDDGRKVDTKKNPPKKQRGHIPMQATLTEQTAPVLQPAGLEQLTPSTVEGANEEVGRP